MPNLALVSMFDKAGLTHYHFKKVSLGAGKTA